MTVCFSDAFFRCLQISVRKEHRKLEIPGHREIATGDVHQKREAETSITSVGTLSVGKL